MTGDEWQTQVVEPLEEHSTANRRSAVENADVVRSAGQFREPITHLFSTEAEYDESRALRGRSG
ncbi:hypothetical protein [Natrarchaeobius oligotrophus]|uniref:hypothetical protein n=1 Tax=Natrarchaeobius oligotrophus TaxID=3455743 RepID=UPI001FB46AB6|nr:hypothetical protein [Natrarchaeobius chitinivorans]